MAKDTKKSILDVAIHEFAAHGYAGARVSRVASASTTNKQLIDYYFGSGRGIAR